MANTIKKGILYYLKRIADALRYLANENKVIEIVGTPEDWTDIDTALQLLKINGKTPTSIEDFKDINTNWTVDAVEFGYGKSAITHALYTEGVSFKGVQIDFGGYYNGDFGTFGRIVLNNTESDGSIIQIYEL